MWAWRLCVCGACVCESVGMLCVSLHSVSQWMPCGSQTHDVSVMRRFCLVDFGLAETVAPPSEGARGHTRRSLKRPAPGVPLGEPGKKAPPSLEPAGLTSRGGALN